MARKLGEVIESQMEGIVLEKGTTFTFDCVRFGTFKYMGDEKPKILFINTEKPNEEPYTTSSGVIIDQMREIIKENATRSKDDEGREIYLMDEPFETTVKQERGANGTYFVLT